MTTQGRLAGRASLAALLLITGCSLHYRRADMRWPATSGPSELRLALCPSTRQAKVGEPILVTVSLTNTADTLAVVHLQDIDGRMQLDLADSNSGTWRYRIHDWADAMGFDEEAYYGIEPGDSVYWRYLLWPQRFYRHEWTTPGVGLYHLAGRFTLILYGRDDHLKSTAFVLCDTAEIALAADSALADRLQPCRALLNMWFDRPGYSAADSILAHAAEFQRATGTAFPYMDYLLTEIARAGHEAEAVDLATRFLTRYPHHVLAEELRGVLPNMYYACGKEQHEDSLATDFITTYPRNAAALNFTLGRRLWRDRSAVPAAQIRVRRRFLGIPGPWGQWRDFHATRAF